MSSNTRTSLKQNREVFGHVSSSPEDRLDKRLFESDRLIQISSLLHTTLDVTQMIELFAQEIKTYVRFDSISFEFEEQNIQLKLGRNNRFKRSYQLNINEQILGDITFSRRIDFEKRETKEIESLLKGLVYPLRNALMYQQALHDVHKDPLTGVKNRGAFNDTIKREIEVARRHGSALSMIVLDIDNFKRINDTFGHSVGDCILQKLANCTSQSIRGTDLLFRYGGEEFVVLLPNTDDKGAYRLAQRIRRKIEKSDCDCDGRTIRLTVSAGVACLGEKDNAHDLFVKADTALYAAKADGRNIVNIYS